MNGDGPTGENLVTGDQQSQVETVSMDDLFSILSRPGNRFVLTYVLVNEDPVSIVDLVEYVLETTDPPAGVPRGEYGGLLLTRFIETVIPELHDRGLVDYDRKAQLVAETEATAETLPYLRAGLHQTTPPPSERDA